MPEVPKKCEFILDIRRKIPEAGEKTKEIRNFLWIKAVQCFKKEINKEYIKKNQ